MKQNSSKQKFLIKNKKMKLIKQVDQEGLEMSGTY
jgi:hypothetical protein